MTTLKEISATHQHVEVVTSDVIFGAFLYLTMFILGSYLTWTILFA